MERSARSESERKRERQLRRSVISIGLFTLFLVTTFSAQTYSYFSKSVTSSPNQIVSDNLDIEMIEMDGTGIGQTVHTGPFKLLPATSVSKTVGVKNTGSLPVYVRIKIVKTTNKDENDLPAGWESLIGCNFKLDDETTPGVTEGPWILHDGYYYYNTSLASGSATAPLFDTVSFSEQMGSAFENSEISLRIICQAAQTVGNTDSPITAVGWPTE